MRKLIFFGLLAAIFLVLVELGSSYVMYRHYAKLELPFQPAGLAAVDFFDRAFMSHFITVSDEGGHVFRRQEKLGFSLIPGQFLIVEHNAGKQHAFHLTVDDRGERATSYAAVQSPKRVLLTGDSSMFGWGVEDEDTFAWLLQARLPMYDVRNMSMTSYSTVHALLQLQQLEPQAGPDDVVVIAYHPITNDFNVASHIVLKPMVDGFEMQLGDLAEMRTMAFPYAVLGPQGTFAIQRIAIACAPAYTAPGCAHPDISREAAQRVTARVLDEIVKTCRAHLLLAVMNEEVNDTVVAHAREIGIPLVNLREDRNNPNSTDVVAVDGHAGPFWHHFAFLRLLEAMRQNHFIS